MKKSCILHLENDRSAKIDYFIITDHNAERPYGIGAKILTDEGYEEEHAKHRFFTYGEAVKTAEFLCRHQVTPCTLCEIL